MTGNSFFLSVKTVLSQKRIQSNEKEQHFNPYNHLSVRQIKAEKDHRKQDMNVKEGRRGREQGGRDDRIKVKVYGKDSIEVGRRPSELRFVEQLIDSEQTQALAQILRFCMEKRLLERYTVAETVAYIQKETAKGGLTAVSGCSYAAMGLCMPRPPSTRTSPLPTEPSRIIRARM